MAGALGIAGCSGDDGKNGAAGPIGPEGPEGPAGPAGPGATKTPVESCTVCHGAGAIGDAVVAHALPPIESVTDVTTALDVDGNLVVTFNVLVDGDASGDYDTLDRAYVTADATRTTITDSSSLAGSGPYTITVAAAAVPAVNSRYTFRLSVGGERSTRVYFYTSAPDDPFEPVAVTAEACGNCHGPEGIGVHGGYFQAEDGGDVCLACHGADDVPSLAAVAHGFHSGIWVEDPEEGPVEVTYPTYMNNCSVCHATDDQLTAVNAMPVTYEGCTSCHGSMDGFGFEQDVGLGNLHLAMNEATNCLQCHAGGGVAASLAEVTDFHNGLTTERDGIIWDGVDTSVTEGALFDWQITGVVDDGTNLAVSWIASYNGVGVDPCNATAGPGAPVFDGDDDGNLSILYTYMQGDDPILGTNPDAAGQSESVNLDTTNTTCAAGVATTTVATNRIAGATVGRIALQGKPRVVSIDPADEDGLMTVRAKTPTYDYMVGSGDMATDRRVVVDTTQCLKCHVGSLYQHGGNRVDNVDMCLLCHNSAANDEYVRADFGVDASEAYDGRAGQAFGMKEMLHAVHSAGATEAPIVIYRGRGIYAWAGSEDQLPNWPGTGQQPVYGSDDGTGAPVLQNHNFHSPTYPRGLYDCAACHAEGFANLFPDPTKAMATTVEAGEAPFGNQLDDVLEGVNASSCMTCHRSGDRAVENSLKAHAYQNGWEPQEFEEGRQTIIDAN
jgi:OmcA/MtrC family decaheme c-type cytochrome